MEEDARDAWLRDNWRIRRNGCLIHAEATLLSGQDRERDSLPTWLSPAFPVGAFAWSAGLETTAGLRAS